MTLEPSAFNPLKKNLCLKIVNESEFQIPQHELTIEISSDSNIKQIIWNQLGFHDQIKPILKIETLNGFEVRCLYEEFDDSDVYVLKLLKPPQFKKNVQTRISSKKSTELL